MERVTRVKRGPGAGEMNINTERFLQKTIKPKHTIQTTATGWSKSSEVVCLRWPLSFGVDPGQQVDSTCTINLTSVTASAFKTKQSCKS